MKTDICIQISTAVLFFDRSGFHSDLVQETVFTIYSAISTHCAFVKLISLTPNGKHISKYEVKIHIVHPNSGSNMYIHMICMTLKNVKQDIFFSLSRVDSLFWNYMDVQLGNSKQVSRSSDVWRWKKLEGPVRMGGDNLPSPGLTELPNTDEGAPSFPASLVH